MRYSVRRNPASHAGWLKADVFFKNAGKNPPKRDCEASVKTDGHGMVMLDTVTIDDRTYTIPDLIAMNVEAVDVYLKETFYFQQESRAIPKQPRYDTDEEYHYEWWGFMHTLQALGYTLQECYDLWREYFSHIID